VTGLVPELHTGVSNLSDPSYHEDYRSSLINQLIYSYINTIDEVLLNRASFGGRIEAYHIVELIHLLDRHLITILDSIDDRFDELSGAFKRQFLGSQRIFLFIEWVIIFACDILLAAYIMILNSCFEVLLALMRRVSSSHILASEQLANYLVSRAIDWRSEELTAEEEIMGHVMDSILCIDRTGVIEMMNPSGTNSLR
jgi:hypothetical protein